LADDSSGGDGRTRRERPPGGSTREAANAEARTRPILIETSGSSAAIPRPARVPEKSILKIRKRQPDPLWTGALIGGAIGLALGATAGACSEECSHSTGSSGCVGPALSMTAIGARVGVGIHALIQGRKVIYQAPGLSFHLSPMIAPGRVGVRVSVGGARNRPRSQAPGRLVQ
jgi:hypothetical protein